MSEDVLSETRKRWKTLKPGWLRRATNSRKDTIVIYEDSVTINIAKRGFLDYLSDEGCVANPDHNRSLGEKLIYTKDIRYVEFSISSAASGEDRSGGYIHIDIRNAARVTYHLDSAGYGKVIETNSALWPIAQHLGKIAGLNCARNFEEDVAISLFDRFLLDDEAKRIRKRMHDKRKVKVDQTVVHGDVVHGDYVDDRDTIIKDSVINRSNVGVGGDDKFTKLKELTEMKEKGLIDDTEFKQMKKEILGFSSKSISEEGNWWEE